MLTWWWDRKSHTGWSFCGWFVVWPQCRPYTGVDCVETVFVRGHESMVFREERRQDEGKWRQKLSIWHSGPWGPEFEPPHFDHKARKHHSVLFCFIVVLAERTLLFARENGVRLATKPRIACWFEAWEVLRAIYCEVISALRPPMTKLNTRDRDAGLVIFVLC